VIDRELHVPKGWIADPDRCQAAGIPQRVGFATKPTLATRMIGRALDAGVPAAWVAGDGSTATIQGCAPTWNAERSGMCWRSPVTTRSAPAAPPSPPTPCCGRSPGVAVHLSRAGRRPAPDSANSWR
jgi:hypothetical protein